MKTLLKILSTQVLAIVNEWEEIHEQLSSCMEIRTCDSVYDIHIGNTLTELALE